MSKRRDVEGHITSLKDIHNIMESMKNFAIMEAHKLDRYQKMQQQVVTSIGYALNDVRYHFTHELPLLSAPSIYLLFGSERGFCGGYNEQLLNLLAAQPGHDEAALIGVGTRLASPLRDRYSNALCLPGPAVADEVDAVLTSVVSAVNQKRMERGALRLQVISFQPDAHQPRCQSALPPLQNIPAGGVAPLINLPSQKLLAELLEQYLFALTHAWLFAALMSENQHRMQHLDQAGHHLERRLDDLGKRRNVLRQEEIIEEIEVILLSSELVCTPGTAI